MPSWKVKLDAIIAEIKALARTIEKARKETPSADLTHLQAKLAELQAQCARETVALFPGRMRRGVRFR